MLPPDSSAPRPARPRAAPRVHVWMPGFSEDKGGIQAFSRAFVFALAGYTEEGKLTVFAKNDRRCLPGLRAGCHVFGRIPEGPLRTLLYMGAMLLGALWQRPDLIIVGHANFSPLAAWIHRLLGVPFWVIAHGIEVWGEHGRRRAKSLRRARRILAVSGFTRDRLVRDQGVDFSKVALLPNSFDPERFRPEPKDLSLLVRLRLSPDQRIILTICRLADAERYKGYDQILEAMPAILRTVPDAHYILAGDGQDADRVRRLVATLGLEQHVTLAGLVPDEEIVAYYNLCDVFAMPSRREGFGIVYLEALACGKPVLAGNEDGSREALCDGRLGVLVDPNSTADIANSLVAILTKTHSHPLIYRPQELRRQVIAAYGPQRFNEAIGQHFRGFDPSL